MKAVRTRLSSDFLEEIDIDTVVLRDGHVPNVVGIRVDTPEFDVAPCSIDELESVPT